MAETFPASFPFHHRLARALWKCTWWLLCRWTPRPMHAWRALILQLWGAKMGARCHVYPGAIIWAPWQLIMDDDSSIADGADIYNASPITFGKRAIVSQGAFLCTGTHDFRDPNFPMISSPITLRDRSWVAARALILPGVTMGEGSIAAAGSVVTKDVAPFQIVGGNPAKVIGQREEKA